MVDQDNDNSSPELPSGPKLRRGVAVAPHLGGVRRPFKRSSSVLHNIRGLSVQLPTLNAIANLTKEDEELPTDETTEVVPIRSEARRSPLKRSSSFSQLIRGSPEARQVLDSLSLLHQDNDRSFEKRKAESPTKSGPRILLRQGSYVLHEDQDNNSRASLSEVLQQPRRSAPVPKFREPATVLPEPPQNTDNHEQGKAAPVVEYNQVKAKQEWSLPSKREAFVIPVLPEPEPPQRQPSHLVQAVSMFGYRYSFAPLYDLWERLQVSHCGRYSVERMLALDEYCQRVSILRVLAVCFLFPLTPLLLIILMELMPLQSIQMGLLDNYIFWIRNGLVVSITLVVGMKQITTWIPELPLTTTKIFIIAAIATIVMTAAVMLIASCWVFPIPFGVITGTPILIVIWVVAARLVLGPHPLEGVQDGSFRARRSLMLTAVNGSLIYIYQAYQAAFLAVDGRLQFGMLAVLTAINIALKNLQVAWGAHLEDNLPEVVIFSVDAFSSIYSVLCLHSANSMRMVAVTLTFNGMVMALSLHGMIRRSRIALACRSFKQMQHQQQKFLRTQSVLDSVVTAGGSSKLLNTLVVTTLKLLQAPGQLDPGELRTIRLLSGMPHNLSKANSDLLVTLAARCVYNNSRRTMEAVSVRQIKSRYASVVMEGQVPSPLKFLPPAPASKLAQRLRKVTLVIPATTRWISTHVEAKAARESLASESSHRGSIENTESICSDKDNFRALPLIPAAETPVIPLTPQPSAPRKSQLVGATVEAKSSHSQSRATFLVPTLWQDASLKLVPLIRKSNPVISGVLQETRAQNTIAVKQTLQLLFNNEYLGLIAYMQLIIPILYLVYMPVLQTLPNRVYYPTHFRYFGNAKEFEQRMTVIGILALLQFGLFVSLQVFVLKRFAVSTIYQVAFVLEKHFTLLQGRLLVWLIFAVQSTLVHYGADFTFRFEWIESKSSVTSGVDS